MTAEALEGYTAADGVACPYMWSSASGIAWHVGRWMRTTGRGTPANVRMSRGYTMHVSGMLVKWNDDNSVERIR